MQDHISLRGELIKRTAAMDRHTERLKECIVRDNLVYLPASSALHKSIDGFCGRAGYDFDEYISALGFERTEEMPVQSEAKPSLSIEDLAEGEPEDEEVKSSMDKNRLAGWLRSIYSDGMIYRECYTTSCVPAAVMRQITLLAREAGQTYVQWLQENGFVWKETGYTEPDMRSQEHTLQGMDAYSIADHVFLVYPLAGQYEPGPAERKALYDCAQGVFRKLLAKGSYVSPQEESVLTLATIGFLKDWTTDTQTEDGDTSIWHYIYLQYGFNPENSAGTEQHIYMRFCRAIRNTLGRYHRFMAPSSTMVYYTSLLLHAIAPQRSIDSLLNILFDFYVKNLDFQYVSEDTSYKALVKGMQTRWDGKLSSDLQLRSDAVMSGLKTLFQERPGYIAVVCDELVRKMDALLRGEEICPEDRWDTLLLDWYRRKSSAERTGIQERKREQRTEYVATTADRIYLQYAMKDGRVGIQMPRFRLPETGDARPVLILYQGEQEVFCKTLSVTGNDLCLTTRSVFVPLDQTEADFSRALEIRGEIEYLGKTLYTSGERLYRSFLVFDMNGMERTPKSGTVFLFADETKNIQIEEDDGVFFVSDHPGQLFRLNLSEIGSLAVDGMEVFADEHHAGKVSIYSKTRPVQGITASVDGRSFRIFTQPLTIAVHIPEGETTKKYYLILDGASQPLANAADKEWSLTLQNDDGRVHRLGILDLTQNRIICEYNYLILESFSWNLDKHLYPDAQDIAILTLEYAGSRVQVPAQRVSDGDSAIARAPFGGVDYEVELPTVRCSFGSGSAFSLADRLWCGSVGKDVFCRLSLPAEWSGALMLGGKELPANSDGVYELGNLLGSWQTSEAEEPLWLSLRSPDGERLQKLLTTLVYEPAFSEEPLIWRDDDLIWSPVGNFIGPEDARFRLVVEGNQVTKVFDLEADDQPLGLSEIPHGLYTYQVLMKPRSLFSREELKLRSGTFIIGDENEFRYENKEVHLRSAICWNGQNEELETIELRGNAGVLEDFVFQGVSSPYADDETIRLPEYEATLCFEMTDGRRIPFSFDENSKEYEWINPVKVWVVSETRLIVCDPDNRLLYLDNVYRTIVGRHPKLYLSRKAQVARLRNPDYFDCETEEA